MQLVFQNPWVLYLLWLVPALFVAWRVLKRRQKRALDRFMSAHMQQTLAPIPARRRATAQAMLMALGLLCMIVAAAGPQWGTREERSLRRGRDLAILVDVSRSMLANDIYPNRLQRAKADLLDLLKDLRGDRAGLIAFRHRPALLCPLTTDHAYLRQALDVMDTDAAPPGETDIGAALRLAVRELRGNGGTHRAIVLVSDGEDLVGEWQQAAEATRDAGIPVFTVGLGSRQGSRIPHPDGIAPFIRHEDKDVVTRLDNETLQAIARLTGGAYIPIETTGMGTVTLGALYHDYLRRISAHDFEEAPQRRHIGRYQWFLFPGIVLLLAAVGLSRGRLARSSRASKPPDGPPERGPAPPSRRKQALAATTIFALFSTGSIFASPASSPRGSASSRDLARMAQRQYGRGEHALAAATYLRARELATGRFRHVTTYNAALSLLQADEYAQAVELLRDLCRDAPGTSEDLHAALGFALCKRAAARSDDGALPAPARAALLTEAAQAWQSALRADRDNATARRNLAIVLEALPDARAEARLATLMAEHAADPAFLLADRMLDAQRALTEQLQTALDDDSPGQVAEMLRLADVQRRNADLWVPLHAKIQDLLSDPAAPVDPAVRCVVESVTARIEARMTNAVNRLRNLGTDSLGAVAQAESGVYQVWRTLAPFDRVLREDIRRQRSALDLTARDLASGGRLHEDLQTEQEEAERLTRLFLDRFTEAVPGPPEAPANRTPRLPSALRQEVLDKGDAALAHQQDAASGLTAGDLSAAQTDQQRAMQALEQIEAALQAHGWPRPPPNDAPDPENGLTDPADAPAPPPPEDTPPTHGADSPPPTDDGSDPANDTMDEEDIRNLLDKALRREREHEELRRKMRRLPFPSSTQRDW